MTPTDRPKAVRKGCVIELFGGILSSLCPFDISVGIKAFVIGLSQISSLLSFHKERIKKKRQNAYLFPKEAYFTSINTEEVPTRCPVSKSKGAITTRCSVSKSKGAIRVIKIPIGTVANPGIHTCDEVRPGAGGSERLLFCM